MRQQAGGGGTPQAAPPAFQQGELARRLRTQTMQPDQTWYVVNFKWFDAFKRFAGLGDTKGPASPPGPIDNSMLVEQGPAGATFQPLRRDPPLQEGAKAGSLRCTCIVSSCGGRCHMLKT